LFPSLLQSSIIFKAAPLLRWHRSGVRLFWRWKKDAPFHRLVQANGSVVAIPLLGGLHYQYARTN
jgi:hypothetical protein